MSKLKLSLKPKFIYDEFTGKKTGVLLTYSDFEKIVEGVEDYYDYKAVCKIPKSIDMQKTYTHEEVMERILKRS